MRKTNIINVGDNMKGTFFLKIGLIFIIASVVTFSIKYGDNYLEAFNNDYLLSRIVVGNVEDNYKDFTEGVNNYKGDMSIFYDSLDFYFDNFIRKNRAMTTYLKEVENDLKKLEHPSLKLYENCKYEVADEDIVNMCENYKTNLKGVIDSYNKLVDDYNEVLDSFNGFANSNGRANDVVPNYESVMSEKLIKIYEEMNS